MRSTRLEEIGHTEESSKLDPQCKSGNQPFWIPTTNRAHLESAFFRTYGTKTRDLNRHAIDPALLREKEPRVEQWTRSDIHIGEPDPNLQTAIDTAEAQLSSMASGRHSLFFKYGLLLARAGFDRCDVQIKLEEIAGFKEKMRRKIPGVLRSLERYGWI